MEGKIKELKAKIIHLKAGVNLSINKNECPICKWVGERFEDCIHKYGSVYKEAMCPDCKSQPRHRMLYLYLKEMLPKTEKISLLHFAPEKYLAEFIKKYENISYINADINEKAAMVKEDITKLSFKDNSFNIILCSHVLEHVQEDKKALGELYRVLKNQGKAIIIVPMNLNREKTYENPKIISEEAREKEYLQFSHLRLYGKDFPEIVKKCGLKLIKEITMKDFTDKESSRYGFGKDIIYVFTK